MRTATIARLETHGDSSTVVLLEEMKKVRADKVREIARLQEQVRT